jgi:hypothetical protein
MGKPWKDWIAAKKLTDDQILAALKAADKTIADPESEDEESPDSDGESEEETPDAAPPIASPKESKTKDIKLEDLKKMIEDTLDAKLKTLKSPNKKPEPKPKAPKPPLTPSGFRIYTEE